MANVFLGEFAYKLDQQRRFAIPREWRNDALEEETYYLMPGRDHTIQVLPEDLFMQEVFEKLKKISFAEKQRTLAKIGRFGQEAKRDKQGRIAISPMLMEYAQLAPGEEIILTGTITGFEIRKKQDENLAESIEEFLDHLEYLTKNG